MSGLAALIAALPELLRLLRTVQKKIDEAETNRKVTDDLKAINEAFKSNDPDKLNHIFNNSGGVRDTTKPN